MGVNEKTAGRLEQSAARALALLGNPALRNTAGTQGGRESRQENARGPDAQDAGLIAARIRATSSLEPDAATAIANDIVGKAVQVLLRLAQDQRTNNIDDAEALALESVMLVRGRPALRVFDSYLESLENHPGSEFWQEFIAMYEERIVASAAATGAAIVRSFSSGNPPWVQGSAWLVAPNRVVTNRHVLLSEVAEMRLVEPGADPAHMRFRGDYSLTIEFAQDDRTPSRKISRRVTEIVYCARPQDPVDIALLAIDPYDQVPLKLSEIEEASSDNLLVVGHPAIMVKVPEAVQAVFGQLDGRKRVSFGKRLDGPGFDGVLPYDASTVGGFSGAPVIGISNGSVAGLHYYGNPVAGNLAIPARVIRAHNAYQLIVGGNP